MKASKLVSSVAVRRSVLAGLVMATLAACGGGGSDTPGAKPAINSGSNGTGSGGDTSAAALSVTLGLTDSAGKPSAVVALGQPLTVTATVRDAKGAPVANTLAAFQVDSELVNMGTSSGSVVTDAKGQASITLTPASLSASGGSLVKVLAAVGNASAQGQAVFSVSDPKVKLNLVSPQTMPVQLQAYQSSVIVIDAQSNGSTLTSAPVQINLSSPCASAGKATLPSQVSTVNGRAQIVYRDQGCGQSDTVTATLAGGNASLNVNINAASASATSVQVANVTPADMSIVIKGAGGSGRSETALVQFRVVDQSGNPIANQNVKFNIISTKAVSLSKTSDTTDAAGAVTVAVSSGTEPTAVRVQATLDNGLSTVSDIISVTTGLPIQAAFSLSAEEFNIEGYDYDNTQTNINLLLADQFGNPVADGVPVVFQTDSGAIGTSARGGCTTANGGCSVPLRSQNPRYEVDALAPQKRAGLATIQVSTLAASATPLTGQIAVFFSGSFARHFTLMSDTGKLTELPGKLALSTNTCGSVSVRLRISDARYNPMPSQTSLSLTDSIGLSASGFYPDTVLSIAPSYTNGVVTGDQGSIHLLSLAPDSSACVAGGSKTLTGTGTITITTPKGNVTALPVSLSYPGQ